MTNASSVPPIDSPEVIDPQSPPWSRNTRRVVAVLMVLVVLALLWRFQSLLAQIVIAWLIAYLLNPVINAISSRFSRVSRTAATLIVYIVLLLILLAAIGMIGVAVVNQVSALIDDVPRLIDSVVDYVGDLTNNPDAIIRIGSIEVINLSTVDWEALQAEALGSINPAQTGGTAAEVVAGSVIDVLDVIGTFFLTLIISIYLAVDLPRFGRQWEAIAHQSGYSADFARIRQELLEIGNAYLRGQAILGLVVGAMTSLLLAPLGVQNALGLGVLSGILEFIPYFGPIISAVVAVVVAFFQPENYLGWGQVQFALATLVVMIIVQQIENTFLVPRIVGDALNLKPVTVMIAVIMGGALFGLLGIVLAAPVAAAVKLLGGYIWRKMLGLPPFPPEEEDEEEDRPSLLGRTLGMIRSRRAHPENVPVPGNPARTVDVTPPGEGEPPSAVKH